jgi:hypothetical protein
VYEHDKVHGAEFDEPIFIKEDGTIINGLHIMLKAVMKGVEYLSAKQIPTEQQAEQSADDEANKFQREKSDPKWSEVLIEKGDMKLTRKQIRDYYIKNKDKIMAEIKDKPVMIYIGTAKNKNILKRNHNEKPIIITNDKQENSGNPDNLIYWLDRRLLSLHQFMGPKTKLGWVDLDLKKYTKEQAVKYAKALLPVLKKELGVLAKIWESGGTGLHIQFELDKEMDIDELREKLKSILKAYNENWEGVEAGVHGSNARSDISTLHDLGNLRVPYSLGESAGLPKKPLEK